MTRRVSVNLITLNEERNLARCLESLTWADEIVIVDGSSRDRTIEIARRFTEKVYVHPFDDFASQRNRALEHSCGDWILSMDADEVVREELAHEILWRTRVVPRSCVGFWVAIESRIFGRRFRHCGTRGERKMRLFRRTAGRWQGSVHETMKLCGSTRQLRHAIEHHSTPDLDTYLQKLMRYSSLEADRMSAAGKSPNLWQTWLHPVWTFAKLYFGKLGLLDGPEGLRFCLLSGWGKWITYQKCLENRLAVTRELVADESVPSLNAEEHNDEPIPVAA